MCRLFQDQESEWFILAATLTCETSYRESNLVCETAHMETYVGQKHC